MESREHTQTAEERKQDMRHTLIASIVHKLQRMDFERLRIIYLSILKDAEKR